jgi:hypothetical protein
VSDLIEYLRGVAENANLPQYMRDRLTEAAAALEAAREDGADAERWRFCSERDVMPVISNDGVTWCMFVSVSSSRRSLFTGKTPAEAVDAAIDQARGKAGQEVGDA